MKALRAISIVFTTLFTVIFGVWVATMSAPTGLLGFAGSIGILFLVIVVMPIAAVMEEPE
jgi:hypothetical protein